VHNPRILLFDEPLSNLDARLRVSMRFEIRRLQQQIGIAALYVTHDQSEAMVISDTVIVMNQGKIEQIGNPLEIYRKPASAFIASFFGEVNFIEGIVAPAQDNISLKPVKVQAGGREHILYADFQEAISPGEKVYVCIRPQDIELVNGISADPAVPTMSGEITDIIRMGSHVEYSISAGELDIRHHNMQDLGLSIGSDVKIALIAERCVCVRK